MISLHEQTTERQNKISFLRLFVLSRCTSRQNEEMEFHFFVCSFCRVGQVAKTNKRQSAKTKFHSFVCSFCRVVQVAKTKKLNYFISSFVRFVALVKARQNDKVTAKYQRLNYRVTCSFCRLFVLSTLTRRQNDRTTTRQNEVLWPFRFVVCSFWFQTLELCKIQNNWFTVTVAPTIEHHGGHSRTPANQRWDHYVILPFHSGISLHVLHQFLNLLDFLFSIK